ncbi:MAG: sugar phosphate isomerase/epimerase [Eubacteriales bacterium]|nr:sugar phosphate isomerase/epimerase [Eubacteriales bacterium]
MKVSQIKIGTCLPGPKAESWALPMVQAGFETLSVNFHMSYDDVAIEEQGPRMKALAEASNVQITTLGYYCNAIQFEEHQHNLERAIDAAALYGAKNVSTFAGAYENKPVDESFTKFGQVFRELAKRAEDKGVKLCIENCPMGGTWQRATCNIGFNPRAWERMFNEVPSEALGLEWEPAHQLIQLIDPIAQLRKWVKKVYHLHGKDATVDHAAVAEYGVLCDTDWYAPERTPGFGDTNWRDIFTILHLNGYTGDVCVEGYHDPVYREDWEYTAQKHALQYLKWCRGGDFTANPW